VALKDILTRIGTDGDTEAQAILSTAKEQAAALVAEATERAKAHRAQVAAAAQATAAREADTILVNARLAARDAEVSARRALIDEVLAATAEALAALPDGEYVRFLAGRIAREASGGERLSFGSEDRDRANAVVRELERIAPQLEVSVSGGPASFARGALLEGARVRADLSLAALVEECREELEIVAARVLFAGEA
jgi:vacuolar-type H+-ATPase subunit E/Vma4